MENDEMQRMAYLDFIKFIGLTGIIIAHIGAPGWAFMARSFDVPLMVIVSSILSVKSYRNSCALSHTTLDYYIRRIKRLLLPTWIFLSFYFLCFAIGGAIFSLRYYIYSFFLVGGIGYVWIILMYIYSAIFVPLFAKVKFSIKSIALVLLVYIIYEIAYYFKIGINDTGVIGKIIDVTFYNIIPYGCVLTFLGCNFDRMKKAKYVILILSSILFVLLMMYYWHQYGSFQQVQIAKYPPRCYYLSYGVAVSFALLIICEKHDLAIYRCFLVQYVSRHSLWIYLWHILALVVYPYMGLPNIWYVKLVIVYALSMMMVLLVNKLLDLVEKKNKLRIIKYLRG